MINSNISNIAIFRALQLGDMLCAIPAIRALRKAYPQARITLIGLPWATAFQKRFPKYFDDFISFPGYPGLPEQNFDQALFDAFLPKVQSLKFDLIIQMQGNGTIVNQLIRSFGARYIAGFCPGPQNPVPNEFLLLYPNHGPEIMRHLELMAFLGIASDGTDLEFPILKTDVEEMNKLKLPVKAGKYICIHPGSRGNWRQWPALYFAALGDYCVKNGYQVVITGTKEELPIVTEVVNLMKSAPIVAAGKTSLGAVAVLIDEAYALISNCTGVAHLAAALKTQSIIISMDGEPERWAPLNKELHVSIDWTKTADYHLVLKEVTALFFRL
ncbi:glycosyltransferase family 9 protein [Pedobacter immunditicola]|uniref:glycosyltransferase family 9 protein n=1 Tax=Pedobacter immunditicola TaxID=3133440 RepID=UPI00309FBF4D